MRCLQAPVRIITHGKGIDLGTVCSPDGVDSEQPLGDLQALAFVRLRRFDLEVVLAPICFLQIEVSNGWSLNPRAIVNAQHLIDHFRKRQVPSFLAQLGNKLFDFGSCGQRHSAAGCETPLNNGEVLLRYQTGAFFKRRP